MSEKRLEGILNRFESIWKVKSGQGKSRIGQVGTGQVENR